MATVNSSEQSSEASSSTEANDKILKSQFKSSAFDREFRLVIKQSQETIQARHEHTIEMGNIPSELVCLNKYLAIYNSMQPQEHYLYFETLYNRNRSAILNCRQSDMWIKNGKLSIQFGEGVKELFEKCKQIRIMISSIYNMAVDLQIQAEKGIDGIDEKFASDIGGKDLIRPNILLLHLMRIFYHLNDSDDKVALGKIVTEIENDLGIPEDRKTVGKEPWNNTNLATSLSTAATGGGLSGLFSMATNMMKKMGYEPPAGLQPPSDSDISNVINTVFNNDTTQNAIQGMFSSLQGCTDFGSAVQAVVKNVTDPTTMEAIQTSVLKTAQDAALNPSPPDAAASSNQI